MLTFPCAKVNLGLNITADREDGYHDLETVFYPVPLTDALEITPMDPAFPSATPCDLKVTGDAVDCDEQRNLVVKAYHLLARDFALPRIHTHLVKRIPSQAGLGGGSADAAYMIRLLNEQFALGLTTDAMRHYAAALGSDCAFFITAEPTFATGRGEILHPAAGVRNQLAGCHIGIVKPDVAVSTAEAFSRVVSRQPARCCRDIVCQPVETWRGKLDNDFETSVFTIHPALADIKRRLYDMGAAYAAMSGSGSAIFGIFRQKPLSLGDIFPDCFTFDAPLD